MVRRLLIWENFLIILLHIIFLGKDKIYVTAYLGADDYSLCPGFEVDQSHPLLESCNDDLFECMTNNLEEVAAVCAGCVIVDGETLQDINNCYCIECSLKALETICFDQTCSNPKELFIVQELLKGFDKNAQLDTPMIVKQGNNNRKINMRRNKKKLAYFKDQNDNLYRNLLQFEQSNLIDGLLSLLQSEYAENSKNKFSISPIWRRKKNKEKKESYTYDTESRPLYYTSTIGYSTYYPKEETLTSWKPIVIESTTAYNECPANQETSTKIKTKLVIFTSTATRIRTRLSTTTKQNTITKTKTILSLGISLATTTEYDTETIRKTRTKIKNKYRTVTDTEYLVETKVKYRNELVTTTETELEETTRLLRIAKYTVTDYDVYTVTDIDTETETETETETKIKVKKKLKMILTTVTSLTFETKTTTEQTTSTKTKKRWFPRTTTITATVTTTETSVSVPMIIRVPMLSGLKFNIFNATDDNDMRRYMVKTIGTPKKTCLKNKGPKVTGMAVPIVNQITKRNISSENGAASLILNTSKFPSNSTNETGLYISMAPNMNSKVALYSAIAVSACTIGVIFIARSWHVPQKEIERGLKRSDLSAAETPHKVTTSEFEETVEEWSEGDTDFSDEQFNSLSVHLPYGGTSLKKLVKQLSQD